MQTLLRASYSIGYIYTAELDMGTGHSDANDTLHEEYYNLLPFYSARVHRREYKHASLSFAFFFSSTMAMKL